MNDITLSPSPSSLSASPLLGPDDPPSFELLNSNGKASVILVCDHASNAVPINMDNLGLEAKELARHIAWDIGAAEVTRHLSARLDAPAVFGGYSRLLIDCNRPPGDPTSIAQVSDGTFIPANHNLSDAEADLRCETFFWPYHHAITNTLAHLWRHGRAPVLVAVHSFTPEFGGLRRPWQVGILWNRDPRLAQPIMERLRAYPDLNVGDNEPYSGRQLGFTMETHAGAAGLAHVEIEIRQDQLADAAGCIQWAELLGDILEVVLQDPAVHTVRHY
ncbi:MAG: N-formylglutamate amidohydrolase [Candidatus Competibacteraceae bacterium]|nr:N-formylglutamate amidohydrolase [Candidatus Competibacteraceae bacterium]